MFTGIIDHCGFITKMQTIPSGLRLQIRHQFQEPLALGESIAVDGMCVTVTEMTENSFYCDISPETLVVTNVKNYSEGLSVNLERSLQLSSRLSGHFVMGHIDLIARIKKIIRQNDFIQMIFDGLKTDKYLIKKGSIAVNGVSLTINELTDAGFSVMLIPHTLERTNLKNLRENDTVNLEFDLLARIVAKQTENLML